MKILPQKIRMELEMKYLTISNIIIFVGIYIFASFILEKDKNKKKKYLGIILTVLGSILKFLNF